MILGIHEPGGGHILMPEGGGWVLTTHALGRDVSDISGYDFSNLKKYHIVARLNHGYGRAGTLPLIHYYPIFALRCANFVRNSKGCHRWIIGNEPNHSQERPEGIDIFAQDYVDCYNLCYRAIRSLPNHQDDIIIPAPVAPWNTETGDWIEYQEYVWNHIDGAGALAIHTYTHGPDPSLITDNSKMDFPYSDRFFNFRTYRDFMNVVPIRFMEKPMLITETNQGGPWLDENNGWIQSAYAEIKWWNGDCYPKIDALIFYRWPRYDQWYIEGKGKVIQMFRETWEGDEVVEVQNLIENPTFVGKFVEDGAPEIKIAVGWRHFYDHSKRRWEWRQSSASFDYSQQWFETSDLGDGGIYQRVYVGPLARGKFFRFVAEVALKSESQGSGIGEYYVSIGVDRLGSGDPFHDQTVFWTTPLHQEYAPKWTQLGIISPIEGEWVTVYIRAYNKYPVSGSCFVKSAYGDVVGAPDPDPPIPTPSPEPPIEVDCRADEVLEALEDLRNDLADMFGAMAIVFTEAVDSIHL